MQFQLCHSLQQVTFFPLSFPICKMKASPHTWRLWPSWRRRKAHRLEMGDRREIQQNVVGKRAGELDTIKRRSSSPCPRTQRRAVGNVPGPSPADLGPGAVSHTPHCPGQPSLQGGGGGVPEVRSPQLSKSSTAQLPGINTTSWAPLRRDHTSSPSQLLSCTLPTQAPHPQRPLLTHAALPSQGPARTLPLPWQARRGALQWKGQERSEAPPENRRTDKNPGTPRCDAK